MKIRIWLIAIAIGLFIAIAHGQAQRWDTEAACRDHAAQYTRGDP